MNPATHTNYTKAQGVIQMNTGIRVSAVAAGLTMLIGSTIASPVLAADRVSMRSATAVPASVTEMRLSEPLTTYVDRSVIDPALQGAQGRQQVLVRLRSPSVAHSRGKSPAAQMSHKARLQNEQAAFVRRANKMARGAKTLSSVQMVLNGVFLEVDASQLDTLAQDRDVARISRVRDYEMNLSETVPYIGAAAVQGAGTDGSGISVAVLDSGIDYTHARFGGDGTAAAYEAAWGTGFGDSRNTTRDGLFPTDKVVGGYDFVGESWPSGADPLAPDPDPIDAPDASGPAGHGTHVAAIIGGDNGVAPGVDLYAVKVCSAVSSACSGIALIQGMEFAVDPDGDGNTKDAVDIINMSLGSNWGQPFDDDLSAAVEAATAIGVLTVSSAGNGSDLPYVTGTPSSAPTALAVAQTQVPSASLQLLAVDGTNYPAVFQTWSATPTSVLSGDVQYGDGMGGGLNGCSTGSDPNAPSGASPFPPGSLTGKIVLVDRGACFFSTKIQNIEAGGGLVGIIGLVAPGAPFAGGFGAGTPPNIPGYMINQADSNSIKAQIGNPGIGTVDPDNQLSLIGQMVGSSSRGPQHEDTHLIKPEVGAPGASVSAASGTGTGESAFGGTSGASPMAAGAAALLLQGFDTNGKGKGNGKAKGLALSPLEAKALLMNTGETNIEIDPFAGLAEITRIGGGEVRVDAAMAAQAAAWEAGGASGALSFGFVDVADASMSVTKSVQVHNYSNKRRSYSVAPSFRFDNDAASGAITPMAPGSVTASPGFGNDAVFDVTLHIDGTALPGNFMNSGFMGANPAGLTINEYDGYLTLEDGQHAMSLPWHILPRKAARVEPERTTIVTGGTDVIGLNNTGVGTAQNDAYALLATSPNQPEGPMGGQAPTPDLRAVGINTFGASFCPGGFIWAFAINTWERQQHLLPVIHQVTLDIDQDGSPDYAVLNSDLSGPAGFGDGRQVTWAVDIATGNASAFFFTEHSMNTGNTVLLVCGGQVGLSTDDLLETNVDMRVDTFDFYYGGPGDSIEGLTVTPLGEQFLGMPNDVPGMANDPSGLTIVDFGPFPGNTPELGIMMFTNGDRGGGARGGATQETEALLFTTP
jgi:subtilisin family serine protease